MPRRTKKPWNADKDLFPGLMSGNERAVMPPPLPQQPLGPMLTTPDMRPDRTREFRRRAREWYERRASPRAPL